MLTKQRRFDSLSLNQLEHFSVGGASCVPNGPSSHRHEAGVFNHIWGPKFDALNITAFCGQIAFPGALTGILMDCCCCGIPIFFSHAIVCLSNMADYDLSDPVGLVG